MTREELRELIRQQDVACAAIKTLRDSLNRHGISGSGQVQMEHAMRSVVQLDDDFGAIALNLARLDA